MNEIEEAKAKIQDLEDELLVLKEQMKEEKKFNDAILTQQAKLASMGEMFGNIAHQWRQPLTEISSIMMTAEAKLVMENSLSKYETLEMIHKSNEILEYLSNTIDDFRNFFSTSEKKSEFTISYLFNKVLTIIANALRNKNIKLDLIVKDNPKVISYENELSQVLINIIINARDILVTRNIKDCKIEIKVYKDEHNCIIEVRDNAGGISVEPLEKIFEPMFSAEKKNGTGIGLYMSKLIIENRMNGKLSASNSLDGAVFNISFPIK